MGSRWGVRQPDKVAVGWGVDIGRAGWAFLVAWSRFSRGRREQWRRFDLLVYSVHQARHELTPRQHDQEGRGSRRQHHEHDFLSHHGKTFPDSCSARCVIIVASSRQRRLLPMKSPVSPPSPSTHQWLQSCRGWANLQHDWRIVCRASGWV